MSRSTKWLVAGLFLIAVFSSVLYSELLGPPGVVWRSEIRKGNRLIFEIEGFRQNRGRLPSDLSEINNGAAEQERFFYKRCN